jgi:hypothetical protein
MTSKNDKSKVFEISQADLGNNLLKVAGRAYNTIKVGDVLFACDPDKATDDCASFRVTGITMYGREIEEIESAFTAWLILEGDDRAVLEKSAYLFNVT